MQPPLGPPVWAALNAAPPGRPPLGAARDVVWLEVGDLGRLYPTERELALALRGRARAMGLGAGVGIAASKGVAQLAAWHACRDGSGTHVVPAGGEAAFVEASPASRAALMRGVEKEDAGAFRALVQAVLEDYYEAPPVLQALGWRGGGVQPDGNVVEEADAVTLARLDRQRTRRPFWRKLP